MKQSRYTGPQRDDRIRVSSKQEDEPIFGELEERRVSFSPEVRRVILSGAAMIVLYVLSILLTINLFTGNLSLAWLAKHILRRVEDIIDLFTGNHLQSGIHFWLCQFAAPVVAGMALGASGACFQALFRNPMASPTMLGVETGGTLGAAIYLLLFYTPSLSGLLQASYEGYAFEYHAMSLLQKYGQYFSVFCGCILVVLVVLALVKIAGHGKISTVPLMIGGTLFTSSSSAVLNVLLYYEEITGSDPTIISELQAMQAGAFRFITSPVMLGCFAALALLPLPVLLPLSGRLNILAFGEDEARLLGVSTGGERFAFILLSTVMTAAVVAFCGAISFLGLIVPHVARYLVGSDFRKILPESAFLGGIFLLLAVDLSYMLNGYIDPGLIVNTIGGFVFMVYMTKYRRNGHGRF